MKKKIAMLLLAALVLLAGVGILASCRHVCSFGEWETVKDATCTEKGLKQRVCLDPSCGKKETLELEIDPTNHNLEEVKASDPDCTTDGTVAHKHCLRCGKYFAMDGTEITQEQTVIHASHTLTDVPAKAADCTTNGNIAYKYCSVCKKNFDGQGNELSADDVTVPASHTLTEVSGVAATKHLDGIVAHSHCNVCGKNFDKDGNELSDVAILAEHPDYNKETMFCETCGKYVITTALQFAAFRDSVNGGNDYAGAVVVLETDIDLNNVEWIPIGNVRPAAGSAGVVFNGTFDGQQHTIRNLKISGNNDGAGLFGFAPNSPSIGNFTVEGADICGKEYASAAIAYAYCTPLHDITVKNAVINASHWAGGITGYSYANITDCHADGLEIVCVPDLQDGGGYDNGDKVGGIVGYFISASLTGCSVKDVTLKGYRDIGGLIGMMQKDGRSPVVTGNSVNGAKLIVDQVTNSYGVKDTNADEIAGRKCEEYTFDNNTVQSVSYEYIVDSSSAQKALDSAKDNTVIKLVAGEYDKLYVRQSKFVSVRTDESNYPHYKREMQNVSVVGVDGTVVKGIEFISGHLYGEETIDPVTGNKQKYYSHIICKNISFVGIKFVDYMEFNGWDSTLFSIDGLEISDCRFDMSTSSKASTAGSFAAVHIGSSDGERNLKNFKFDSCEFLNAFQGIYAVNVENISVTDCKFDNIKHNAVALQSSANGGAGGNIVIENNTFSNGTDRVVRFGNIGADAVISISDNVITDYSDADGEIVKSGVMSVGATLKFENNLYNRAELTGRTVQGEGEAIVFKNS